jgi:adenosylhomocysteine nucleosidase
LLTIVLSRRVHQGSCVLYHKSGILRDWSVTLTNPWPESPGMKLKLDMNAIPDGCVNILVALDCEARPLIDQLCLRRVDQVTEFPLYANDSGLHLLVCGVGKFAIATACGFLAAIQKSAANKVAAWLNIGIAGHQCAILGSGLLAHKVTDASSGKTFYPPQLLNFSGSTTDLITVAKPETEYPRTAAYDMEASIFYDTALRFSSAELIQIYKIVSDNPGALVTQINKQNITEWVRGRLDEIRELIKALKELSSKYNALYSLPEECIALKNSLHLTQNQKMQLEALYRRYYALGNRQLSERLKDYAPVTGRELLKAMNELLDEDA